MEQLNLFDYIRPTISVGKKLKLIELFAGYGSQAMALKRLGVDFEYSGIGVSEIDEFAIKSYNAIHGTDFKTTDIKQIKGSDLDITDKEHYQYLLIYSFPCTDLSLAGRMQGFEEGSGTRSSLLWEVKRLLIETENKPDILLMENVTAIHSQENKPHFKKWLNFLEELGYTNFCQDLNACDYGVAQSRDRTFVISILGGV